MSRGHHHHDHGPTATGGNERRVFWAMVLTGDLAVVEGIGCLVSDSLALLADAGHMVSDFVALLLARLAFRLGRRPGEPRWTFGYSRFQVLAAFVNGLALIVVVGWILVEAVERLMAPVEVAGGTMMAEAVAGLLVILLTGWMPIDPILSLAVALLIVRSAWFVIRRSAHTFLEGTPEWLDIGKLECAVVAAVPGVEDVHHGRHRPARGDVKGARHELRLAGPAQP